MRVKMDSLLDILCGNLQGDFSMHTSVCSVFTPLLTQRLLTGCSSMVRAFAHGAMGRQIDPSWSGPIELFLVPARTKGCGMC